MPAFVTFGRILFAVLFIYTGAARLFAMQATVDFIAAKVVVPDMIAPYAKQIETATAMTTLVRTTAAGPKSGSESIGKRTICSWRATRSCHGLS